jgi:hypothetical protein
MYRVSAMFWSACGYSPIKRYSAVTLLLLTPNEILELASKSPSKDIREMISDLERLPPPQNEYVAYNRMLTLIMLPDVVRIIEAKEQNIHVRSRSL